VILSIHRILPTNLLYGSGILTVKDNYKGWIGIIVLAAYIFFVLRMIDLYFFPWQKRRKTNKAFAKSFGNLLETMSKDELEVLSYCLSREQSTLFVGHDKANLWDYAIDSILDRGFFDMGPQQKNGRPYTFKKRVWSNLQINRDRLIVLAKTKYERYDSLFIEVDPLSWTGFSRFS
jgi:hypothetical protein